MSFENFVSGSRFSADHFALLDLPRQQGLDSAELDRRFRHMQALVHPDRHVQAGDVQQRLAMQWATRVNEAYQVLKSPGQRALYLLTLLGFDPQVESNTAMPIAFLMQQMEFREEVMAARAASDEVFLDAAHATLQRDIIEAHQQLITLIDHQHDYKAAAELVRKLMFQEKLLHEINDALEAVTP
ncbi:MAG: Fe-S protein assembly co-chaperone HscB [Rugosibacter sp.]|jgi:molecular chaperone HscB|nr:Fe-S protein assembly co-chaperone HscB [Rugosibacter sp.]